MTPARFRWGVLLIFVGTLILLQKTDTIDGDVWRDLVYYVPYLLIAIGIEKLFTRSRFEVISYATTVLLIAGAVYVVSTAPDERDNDFFDTRVIEEPYDPEVTEIDAQLSLSGGGLTIRDATDELVYAKFGQWTFKPKYKLTREGSKAQVELASSTAKAMWGVVDLRDDEGDDEGGGDWHLMFSRDIPLRLTCDADRSDLHLNLSTTPLEALDLRADDADIYIKLGDLKSLVKVDVRGADSKLRLRVPRDAGLRVVGVGDDEYLLQVGLNRDNGAFVSDGYDTLQNRIDVNLDDKFRSLSIDYY